MTELPQITKLNASNYKNLHLGEEGITLGSLNILVGPNGSGKSNFVNLLRFLRDSLVETSTDERGVTGLEAAIDNLAADKVLDATLSRPANVTFRYDFQPTQVAPFGTTLQFELFVQGQGKKVFIGKESLTELQPRRNQKNPFCFYKAHEPRSGSGLVSAFSDGSPGKSHFERLSNIPTNRLALATIPELLVNSLLPPEKTPIYKTRRELVDTISRWHFYNASEMNIGTIRRSEPKIGPSDRILAPSGENIALVYDNLVQDHIEFEDRLQMAMQAILPKTKRVRAVRSGRLSLTIEWYFEGVPLPFYLNELSDGTVRMLCWALVLLSPEPPSLVVIDEPELSLHPAWMPILAEWIKFAADRTQVFISTHSADLLDAFSSHVEQVYVFDRSDDTHFEMKRLSLEGVQAKLDEGWQLGDLYRVGDPGVGGWPW